MNDNERITIDDAFDDLVSLAELDVSAGRPIAKAKKHVDKMRKQTLRSLLLIAVSREAQVRLRLRQAADSILEDAEDERKPLL